MDPKFVLAWITSSAEERQPMESGGHVVFVKHPERGWEIPGGHLKPGESPDQALVREVLEETGLAITVIEWNTDYYSNGWVAHAVTESIPSTDMWETDDKNVEQIGWWNRIPPVVKWTKQEFIDLDRWVSSLT